MLLRRLCAAAIAAPLALCAPVLAQATRDLPVGTRVPYALDTGSVAAAKGAVGEQVVFSREVTVAGAAWLRLHFAEATLAPGAAVVVRAAADGETQRLDAAGLDLWDSSTAYFNGDTVLLQVVAPGGSAADSRIVIQYLETEFAAGVPGGGGEGGLRGDPGQCGICNADDRIQTTQLWTSRFMPVGCTASIVCEDNTFVTAGHCMTGNVVQFNVPNSQPNCNLVNPPVADQFPVISATRRSENAGVGADWGVFRAGVNSLNQTPFERYGQLRRLAPNPVPDGSVVNNFAYGADTDCVRNQTQQRSVGSITNVAPDSYRFNADVRGGSSGSTLLVLNQVVAVVTHCSGDGCGNSATRVDSLPFRTAINEIMDCDVTHTLQVRATRVGTDAPVAAAVSISPADNNGASGGAAPFDRTYLDGVTLTVSAPGIADGLCFQNWQLNGVDQGPSASLTLTITAPVTVTARYGACCQTDWNADQAINSSDISAYLTAWLQSIQNGTLAADFNHDSAVNSTDISAFLTQWLTEVTSGC